MCLFISFLFCRFLVRAGSNPGCSYHTCFSAFLSISNYAMADRVLVWTLTHFFKGGLVVSVCVVRPGLCASLFLFSFFFFFFSARGFENEAAHFHACFSMFSCSFSCA